MSTMTPSAADGHERAADVLELHGSSAPDQCGSGWPGAPLRPAEPVVPRGNPTALPVRLRGRRARRTRSGPRTREGSDGRGRTTVSIRRQRTADWVPSCGAGAVRGAAGRAVAGGSTSARGRRAPRCSPRPSTAATGELVARLSRRSTGVDATGLGVLVGAHRRARRAGRTLVLRDVPAPVARLLLLSRLDRVLRLRPRRRVRGLTRRPARRPTTSGHDGAGPATAPRSRATDDRPATPAARDRPG